LALLQQGRDVAELHARSRPVRHGADMVSKVLVDAGVLHGRVQSLWEYIAGPHCARSGSISFSSFCSAIARFSGTRQHQRVAQLEHGCRPAHRLAVTAAQTHDPHAHMRAVPGVQPICRSTWRQRQRKVTVFHAAFRLPSHRRHRENSPATGCSGVSLVLHHADHPAHRHAHQRQRMAGQHQRAFDGFRHHLGVAPAACSFSRSWSSGCARSPAPAARGRGCGPAP
jgi:hypothetical protein